MQLRRSANHPGQLSLPLFDAPVAEALPSLPSLSPALFKPVVIPDLQKQEHQVAAFTAPPPAILVPPPRHDQRMALLLGVAVHYVFRRSSRKTIGFQIGDEGLTVTAPRWVRLADVDEAMQEKARWILGKLNEQRERREELVQRRIEWRDGATLPFMGADITIELDSALGDALFDAEHKTLRIGLSRQAEPQQIKDRVQAWLQRQAKRVFEERVAHFAERLRVQVKVVKLSNANTRWGTAGIEGDIRLNWRLIHFALPVIDYVAAHEVAHLREMNHGPAFWATVKSIFPEYEAAKAQLKDEKLPQLGE